jgi:cysteinyl-tRNA synthetase
MPYILSLSTFRDSVRRLAMGRADTALQDILAPCDRLRNVDLVPLGVAQDTKKVGDVDIHRFAICGPAD